MVNINAGDEGAMEFIIASQKAGENWLNNLKSKVNNALEKSGKKMLFFHDYANTFWVVPVRVETDEKIFVGDFLKIIRTKTEDIFSDNYRIEKAEARTRGKIFVMEPSGWYAYLEPSRNLVTIRGPKRSDSLEIVRRVFAAEGLVVQEEDQKEDNER